MQLSPATPPPDHALCVLASGSRGNCSVLVHRFAGAVRATLLDLGLSPRRTTTLLAALGLSWEHIDAVLLTHLDHDHCHPGWCTPEAPLPRHLDVFLPKGHRKRAQRQGFAAARLMPFASAFSTRAGLGVEPIMQMHDSLGTAAFRISSAGGTLGFATDLGRVTPALVHHLRQVDILAIESNYCPELQLSSDRPEFLKRRIMGGAGHLSNQEAAEAARQIAPRDHVVLLHLSQQCNRPDVASGPHAGAPYRLTVTCQEQPTAWIRFEPDRARPTPAPATRERQGLLFA